MTNLLSEQINSRITLDGDAEVNWLNQVVLNDVTIYDQQDDTLLHARRAMVAFDLLPLLSNHLVLNTCQLIDFDIRTYRVSADSAANYQFLIDAFRKDDDPDRKPFIQQLDLNAILLRQGRLSYNVLDQPHLADSPIDPNHISIEKLSANVHVHDTHLLIKKFHCFEHNSSIRAERCELSLNVKEVINAPEGDNRFLFLLKGLELTNPQLTVLADANGTSDELEFDLKQLDLPSGHPRLKRIHNFFTSARLRISQLKNPIDSLYLSADIRELRLRVDTLGNVRLNGSIQGMPCHALLAGNLSTDIGSAVLDADFEYHKPDTNRNSLKDRPFRVKGHCKTSGFELDRILPRKTELGHAVFDLDYEANIHPRHPLRLILVGNVGEIVADDPNVVESLGGSWFHLPGFNPICWIPVSALGYESIDRAIRDYQASRTEPAFTEPVAQDPYYDTYSSDPNSYDSSLVGGSVSLQGGQNGGRLQGNPFAQDNKAKPFIHVDILDVDATCYTGFRVIIQ